MSNIFTSYARLLFTATPKPGDKYILDDDPFNIHYAEVLEVKKGWVKFRRSFGQHSTVSTSDVAGFKMFWKRIV
jgi:hypothetical protein